MPRQQVVALAHEVSPHVQEMDAVEHDGVVVDVFVDGTAEIMGMFGPVHIGFHVMADVIAIVPALVVVLGIDTGDAVFIRVARVFCAHERMLRPVAQHHHDAGNHEGDDKHDQRGRPVDEAHPHTERYEQELAPHGTHQQLLPFLPHEITGQVVYAGKEETTQVSAETAQRIALETHGAALVFGQVVLRVVHADMMAIIRFRRLPEQRPDHPRQVMVHEIVFLPEKSAVAGAMQHQPEWAFEYEVVEDEISGGQYAPPPTGNERHVEQHGERDKNQRDPDGQVHKRQISFIADKRAEKPVAGRSDVRLLINRVRYVTA